MALVIALAVAVAFAFTLVGRRLAERWPKHRLLTWFLLGLTCSSALLVVGQLGGQVAVDALKPRLDLLWPDAMATLPEADRVLVLQAAVKCDLLRAPVVAAEVAQCLRAGAHELDADDPDMPSTNRLEALLRKPAATRVPVP